MKEIYIQPLSCIVHKKTIMHLYFMTCIKIKWQFYMHHDPACKCFERFWTLDVPLHYFIYFFTQNSKPMLIFEDLLEWKWQVVIFAEFHFKYCQSIRKLSHMGINRIWLCKKKQFEYPYLVQKDSRKAQLAITHVTLHFGSSNLYSRSVIVWRYNISKLPSITPSTKV